MPCLTVFTPTFNRRKLIERLYESLRHQTAKNFVWLVVDDGSSDGTKELINGWLEEENGFEIEYVYKKNGGMHTAHNMAYDNIHTKLNVCIDSDDCMPPDAVEIILKTWSEYEDETLAGIVGLDYDINGNLIGTNFGGEFLRTTLNEFYARGGTGDKKVVLRTDVVNQFPRYPEFEDEKLVPLGTLYVLIDQEYELLVVNEPLVIVAYQEGGSSDTIFRQYRQSPRGFSYARVINMCYGLTFKKRFVSAVHYVSSSIFERNLRFLSTSPRKGLTLCAIVPGMLLNLFIRLKTGLRRSEE